MSSLTGGNFEERCSEPSPHIWESFGEVVGKSPLLKGGNTVGDNVPDLGQVSKVTTHVDRAELNWKEDISKKD